MDFNSDKLMKNGIMFLWCEKELIEGVLKIMEKINFHYVENFVFGVISAQKGADPIN